MRRITKIESKVEPPPIIKSNHKVTRLNSLKKLQVLVIKPKICGARLLSLGYPLIRFIRAMLCGSLELQSLRTSLKFLHQLVKLLMGGSAALPIL
jgi:hypothetical protein